MIGFNALTSGTTTATDPISTASISPSSNALILIAIQARSGSGNPAAPSVTGNGITYTLVDSFDYDTGGTEGSIFLFRGMAASPSSGVVTIDFAATQSFVEWSICEFTGVDTSGTNGSGAVVQTAKDPSLSDQSVTSVSVALATFDSSENATYGMIGKDDTGVYTEDTNMTEIHDLSAGSGQLGTQYRLAPETSVDWSFAVAVAGAIALEIAVAAAAEVVGRDVHFDFENKTKTVLSGV